MKKNSTKQKTKDIDRIKTEHALFSIADFVLFIVLIIFMVLVNHFFHIQALQKIFCLPLILWGLYYIYRRKELSELYSTMPAIPKYSTTINYIVGMGLV